MREYKGGYEQVAGSDKDIRKCRRREMNGSGKLLHWMKIPVYTLVFVLLGLIFGYLTFEILSFSRTVEVPLLEGKTLLESNKLVNSKGLYLKIEGEEYSSVPEGSIVTQDIPAGKNVKEKRGIKVVISKGPRVTMIPVLVNETLINAETLLLQKGLKLKKMIGVHSDTVEKGRIIAQRPEPDEAVSDSIAVVVSLGPAPKSYTCPDFEGITPEEAKELAGKLGLMIVVQGEGDSVLSQKPEAGRSIRSGDTITLKLS
jgi:beta-lactam-binding protein with PASTA domain